MEYKVAKFGGSSLATAERIKSVGDIVASDSLRKYVVVSAPGKAKPEDDKITDHLINIAKDGLHIKDKQGNYIYTALQSREFIDATYLSNLNNLNMNPAIFNEITDDLDARVSSKYFSSEMKEDCLKSWGEDSSAKVFAAHLNDKGIKATYVNLKEVGFRVSDTFGNATVLDETYNALAVHLPAIKGVAVLPGFFGYTGVGQIATFSRGGSDLTGAIVAAALGAKEYENWTDVNGIYSAMPKFVKCAILRPYLTFSEIRELSCLGFSVLHDEAISPVRRYRIPTHIRNTNHSNIEGTRLVTARIPDQNEVAAGVAFKSEFCSFDIRVDDMNKKLGFLATLTNIFYQEKLSIEHLVTGVDFVSVSTPQDQLSKGRANDLYVKLHDALNINDSTDSIEITTNRSMVITVGEGLKRHPYADGRILTALANAGIRPGMISKPEHGLSIICGVDDSEAVDAVNAIHQELIG